MSSPSRRDVLASLATATAAALMWGCGGSLQVATARTTALPDGERIRDWLVDAVTRLSGLGLVTAQAWHGVRAVATVDPAERRVDRFDRQGVKLAVTDAAGRTRIASSDELSAAGVELLIAALGSKPSSVAPSIGSGEVFGTEPAALLADKIWLGRVDRLVRRIDRLAPSRVVHRGVRLEADDEARYVVSPGRMITTYARRSRLTMTLVGWTGTQPRLARVIRGSRDLLSDAAISDAVIGSAMKRSTELMSPMGFAAGDATVAMSPRVVAALAAMLVKQPDLAARVGSAAALGAGARLVADPTDLSQLGGSLLDDSGANTRRTTVLGANELVPAATARNLDWAAGTVPRAELLAMLAGGYLLEDPSEVTLDGAGVVLRCGRARRMQHGEPTGHVFADVVMTAPLSALLSSMTVASLERALVIAPGDEFASATVPTVLARGYLRRARP